MGVAEILRTQFQLIDSDTTSGLTFSHYERAVSAVDFVSDLTRYIRMHGYETGESMPFKVIDIFMGGQFGSTKGMIRLIALPGGLIADSSLSESIITHQEIGAVISGKRGLAEAAAGIVTHASARGHALSSKPGEVIGNMLQSPAADAVVFPKARLIAERYTEQWEILKF